jgi:hypothetical protein
MRVLEEALRDPAVVARYRAKILEVPARTACGGPQRSPGAVTVYVGTVPTGHDGADDREGMASGGGRGEVEDMCVIAHRFGYALIYGRRR